MSAVLTDHEDTKQAVAWLKMLTLLPVLIFGLLLNAYFLLLLWHWFVVPLGVQNITYWQSAGLSTAISYFFGNASRDETEKERDYQYWIKHIKAGFKRMAFFFVIAWLCHLLMAR